jgi:hypothetical protein
MTFRVDGSNNFLSFASYSEVVARDQRFFEANEGITQASVETLLEQASQRILTQIRNTDWWRDYQFTRDSALENDLRLLPAVTPARIRAREQEFKDSNIAFVLSEYLFPKYADFGDETSAEVQKIKFYRDQYTELFEEIIESGDWYDYDADSTVERLEKSPARLNRIRRR